MMKKGINGKPNLAPQKTTTSIIPQKRSKINHNTIKVVEVELDTQSHRKLNSCSTSTKKIIAIPTPALINNQNRQVRPKRNNETKKKPECYHYKSNSIKEDIRKRNCRSLVKPIGYATPQKMPSNGKQKQVQASPPFINSNCVLTTNFTENKEEKGKLKEVGDSLSLSSLKYLQNIFRTSNLKKTIIIDEKGNTNLFKISINSKNHNKRETVQKPFCNSLKEYIPPITHYANNISNMNKRMNKANELMKQRDNNNDDDSAINNLITTSNNNKIQIQSHSKEAMDNESLINLLNQNSRMDINEQDNSETGKRGLLFSDDGNKDDRLQFCGGESHSRQDIFTQKERDEIGCLEFDNNNNSKEHIDNKSFLESCLQEDLFSSFIKCDSEEQQKSNNVSFNYSTLLANKNDTNILNTNNYDQTTEKGDSSPVNLNTHPYFLNPRLLLKKKQLRISKAKLPKEEQNQCLIY